MNLWIKILKFSVPLVFTNLLQVLFNAVDVAVVGRFAGALALGAVGSASIPVALFTGSLIGIASGMNVLIAQAVGANDTKVIKDMVHNSALLSLLVGMFMLVMALSVNRVLLLALNTKEELLEDAILYTQRYFLGLPALALYNYGNAVLSAAGDTRRPLYFLTAAGILNVVLKFLLVFASRLTVVGAAATSVISQYFSAVLILGALLKSREDFGLCIKDLRLRRKQMAAILALSLPSGAPSIVLHLANLFVQRSLNTFSATVVAGSTASANADNFINAVLTAFYIACACFVGQNFGAGKRDDIRKSYFVSVTYALLFGTMVAFGILLFGRSFLSLFTTEATVVEAGLLRLAIMCLSYPISVFMDASIAASRGLGKTVIPTIIVISGCCVFRLIWIFTVFEHIRTILSLYLIYPASWGLTAIAETIYFIKVYKKQTANKL